MPLTRSRRPAAAATLAALAASCLLAACGDDPSRPTGPVTVVFVTLGYYSDPEPTAVDSARARAIVSIDGGPEMEIRTGDSITNVPRGEHTLTVKYDIDYLTSTFKVDINPNSSREELFLPQSATCRFFPADQDGNTSFCTPGNPRVKRNILSFSGTERLICAANDFGEFCSTLPDENQLGGTWPETGINQYVAHAKLLIAATVPQGGAGTRKSAMSLYNPGDYSPRYRLRPFSPTDSTRYQNEVWTDARHVPFYFSTNEPPRTSLGLVDRFNANFGLSVTNTYYRDPNIPDAIFVRFDVKNISNDADFRRVNPEVPAAGQTISNIWLTPFVDATLGIAHGSTPSETSDDNATVFPEDNLIAAYDQTFSVSIPASSGVSVNANPGIVGFQFLSGPAGTTPRAVIIDRGDSLSFRTAALEDQTYRILAAGRDGDQAGCALRSGVAYICAPDTANDVLTGWSVGPVASLAPGQTVSLTVAILVALPTAGSFTSGAGVGPEHDRINDNSRTIAQIAADLRTLSQLTRGVVVP